MVMKNFDLSADNWMKELREQASPDPTLISKNLGGHEEDLDHAAFSTGLVSGCDPELSWQDWNEEVSSHHFILFMMERHTDRRKRLFTVV